MRLKDRTPFTFSPAQEFPGPFDNHFQEPLRMDDGLHAGQAVKPAPHYTEMVLKMCVKGCKNGSGGSVFASIPWVRQGEKG